MTIEFSSVIRVKEKSLKKADYFVAIDAKSLHVYSIVAKSHLLELPINECSFTIPLENGETTNTFFITTKNKHYKFRTTSNKTYQVWVYILASQMKTNGLFCLPLHVVSFKTKTSIPLPALRCLTYLTNSINELQPDFFKKVLTDREKKEVVSYTRSLQSERDVDITKFSSPNIAKYILLKFIDTLPLPIIPITSSAQLVMSLKQENINLTKKVITKLPDENRLLFFAILKFVTQVISKETDFSSSAYSFLSSCFDELEKSVIPSLITLFQNPDFISCFPSFNTDLPVVEFPARFHRSLPPFPTLFIKQLVNQNTKHKEKQLTVDNKKMNPFRKTMKPPKNALDLRLEHVNSSKKQPDLRSSQATNQFFRKREQGFGEQDMSPNGKSYNSCSLTSSLDFSQDITFEEQKKIPSSLMQTTMIIESPELNSEPIKKTDTQNDIKQINRSNSGQSTSQTKVVPQPQTTLFPQNNLKPSPPSEGPKWVLTSPRSLPLSPLLSPRVPSPGIEKSPDQCPIKSFKKVSKLQFFKEDPTNPKVYAAKRIVELECLYDDLKAYSLKQQEIIDWLRKAQFSSE
ncbi:hypothetical protein QTN25_000313 [Entamoeba marina]